MNSIFPSETDDPSIIAQSLVTTEEVASAQPDTAEPPPIAKEWIRAHVVNALLVNQGDPNIIFPLPKKLLYIAFSSWALNTSEWIDKNPFYKHVAEHIRHLSEQNMDLLGKYRDKQQALISKKFMKRTVPLGSTWSSFGVRYYNGLALQIPDVTVPSYELLRSFSEKNNLVFPLQMGNLLQKIETEERKKEQEKKKQNTEKKSPVLSAKRAKIEEPLNFPTSVEPIAPYSGVPPCCIIETEDNCTVMIPKLLNSEIRFEGPNFLDEAYFYTFRSVPVEVPNCRYNGLPNDYHFKFRLPPGFEVKSSRDIPWKHDGGCICIEFKKLHATKAQTTI